ncbi:MAG: tetratricopeptide (TPR) repeat protein [Maribacter sp.]
MYYTPLNVNLTSIFIYQTIITMNRNYYFALIIIVLTVWACTPKVAKETVVKEDPKTETPTPPKEEPVRESTCPTFKDAPNEDKATTDYVLLKDEIRAKNYEKALPMWEEVYANTPAADGRRNLVFMWGVEIYNDKFKKETDPAKKKAHVAKVMEIYDALAECYPKEKGFVQGRKAFDMYYNYPDNATQQEKYDLFKISVDTEGMKTQPFVLNPFTALLREQFDTKAIDVTEAKKYATLIQKVLDNGLKTAKGQPLANFKLVEGYAPFRLAEFESTKGFYDCDYYMSKYIQEYEDNKNDCDVLIDICSTLRWGNCPEADAKLKEINAAYDNNCVEKVVVVPGKPIEPSCNDLLRAGDFQGAIDCLKAKYESTSDNEWKGKYAYSIGQVYYSKFKQYSTARTWAEKASNHLPSWGKPYLLIGDMYASSGPICGPGTGWDSQVVLWPAMDMWNKAKSDPSTSSKAQRQINKYSQYLPENADGFMRSVKEGDSYKLKCWINRTTRARFK